MMDRTSPFRIVEMTEVEVISRAVESDPDTMALRALLHYQNGHWSEAQAAALTSIALREMEYE